MKRIFLVSILTGIGMFSGACQKQESDAERQAEIERQVQERLDARQRTQQQQELDQRQAELDAREQALKENQDRTAAAPAKLVPVATATPAADETPNEPSSYTTFYRKLDPYGDWMETSAYGYVFQPRVAAHSSDWRPYANGHWVYTDAGWTWISEEKFGWATYHYGRWMRLRSVGWVWVPGQQWAPAWVSWRRGNDYVGWAPLPPEAQFDRHTGIRNWADTYYDIGPEQYNFVPANEFGRRLTPREIVPPQRNVTIINQTTNVTNITYNNSIVIDRGPSYDDLKARSHQPIERLRLERTQNFNDERPVIRGEVVALPTLDFLSAPPQARPNRVTRTIAQPVAERGWSGIKDAQAAQKAREKMRAEATPPPNAPSKRFVRPESHAAIPPRPAPQQVGKVVAPSVPKAKMEPVGTPAPAPSVPPAVATAPAENVQPSPAENIPSPKAADRARKKKEAERKERQEEQAERKRQREEKIKERKSAKSESPAPSATASASPATTASASPTASPSPNEKKNLRGKARHGKGQQSEPGATPTPNTPYPKEAGDHSEGRASVRPRAAQRFSTVNRCWSWDEPA